MKKTIIQGFVTIFMFLLLWFGLSQIDWIKILKIEKVANKTEQKLGELFLDTYKNTENENKNLYVYNTVDSIVTNICKANNIYRESIKLHIIKKEDINAFALPNGHLIIYSGLIKHSDNQDQLAGVICHEMAHITLNHVMKKLVKEIGLSVLISMTTGQSGTEIIKETGKMLSSSAFDRDLEKKADIKAVDYLINAKVNPEPFANFLYKLSASENEVTKYLTWLSTHPDSKERAEYIIEYSKNKLTNYDSILSKDTWKSMKVILEN